MTNNTLLCSSADSDFGPGVASNCSSFDFTLTFEDSVLSVLPSSLFILSFLPRIYFLRRSSRKVGNGTFKAAKLVGPYTQAVNILSLPNPTMSVGLHFYICNCQPCLASL